jgi:hypothetical protein
MAAMTADGHDHQALTEKGTVVGKYKSKRHHVDSKIRELRGQVRFIFLHIASEAMLAFVPLATL